MRVRCPTLKEPYTNALQVAIAVFIATALGYGIVLPDAAVQSAYARQFSQACKWSAITSLTISAPVIGKVAQTGAERILGTFVGGSLGFLTYIVGRTFWTPDTRSDGVTLSLAATLVAYSSVVLGKKLNLAYSAKLYGIAFLIVTFGAVDEETTGTSVFLLASMRVLGIACGVIILELTAILVYPRSATQEAVAKMGLALEKLAELNRMTWLQGPWESPSQNGKSARADGYETLPGASTEGEEAKAAAKEQAAREDKYERLLMDVYNALYKVEEQTPLAAAEVYLFTWRGHLCFLPGLPWLALGRWHLPKAQMDALATCVRRVARLLWSINVSFVDGFDENMLYLLQQQYPSDLMPLLAEHSQGALQEAVDAFPGKDCVISSNLTLFVTAVEGLMRISDYQRRRILHLIKHFKSAHKQQTSFSGAHSWNGASSPAPGRLSASHAASMPHRSALAPGSPKGVIPPPMQQAAAPPSVAAAASGLPATSAVAPGLQTVPEQSRLQPGQEAKEDVFAKSTPEQLMLEGHDDGDVGHRPPRSSSLTEALASEAKEAADSAAPGQPPVPPKVEPGMSRPEIPWTLNRSYYGTPSEALEDLPDGLSINVADLNEHERPSFAQHEGKAESATDKRVARRLSTMRLQRVESAKLVEFPETVEGFFGKVRWYSFLFTMQELAEELEDLHDTVDDVLAILHRVMGS
ncbi:g10862 [Coccomyxa viridis]|uniref:G10862 protein n=1 Tax=Coccomyxa viridis TaxID=1274662 RepID=A0ABP1GDI1_9CHLO